MITSASATVCACGYEISQDEDRQYIDGEAHCITCLPNPGYTSNHTFRSHA